MDIRKWFTSPKVSSADSGKSKNVSKSPKESEKAEVKSKAPKKRKIISDSDSDEELKIVKKKHESPKAKKQLKSEKSTGGRQKKKQISSSDEEIIAESDTEPIDVSKAEKLTLSKKPALRPLPAATKSVEKTVKKTSLKAASVSDFFGSAPVERPKRQTPKKTQKDANSNLELNHEDEDFSKTLLQLEESPKSKSDEKVKEKSEPKVGRSPRSKDKISRHPSSDIEVDPSPTPVVEEKKSEKDLPQKKSSPKGKGDSAVSKKRKSKKFSSEIEFEPSPEPAKTKKKEVIKVTPPAPPQAKKNKGNASSYMSYLHRDGPKALGSKEIPEGEEGCLEGMTFVVTGVLESVTRDETKELIEKHGGKLMTTLTKNTSYVVIGRDAGPSKLEKAEKLQTKRLDEDELFDLVRNTPGKGPKKEKKKCISEKIKNDNDDVSMETASSNYRSKANCLMGNSEAQIEESISFSNALLSQEKSGNETVASFPGMEMWVDKYKPSSLKQVIGQQGEQSLAKKLLMWLTNWNRNTKNKKAAAAGRWNNDPTGSSFKAALLSGPPGIGKTTTAQLACKETGFDFFELNASDTRSKKSLQEMVAELLRNQSLVHCFKDGVKGTTTRNHAVIMDEVDGMAGNEDRGGIQELIGFIKASKIPIICICNDRNHPKIRSLSNYCFDLRFQRPRVAQIKAAVMSIAFKEGLKITPEVLNDVITASNQDIRQVLHNLSMWCAKEKGLSAEQAKVDIGQGTKHIKMSPFDALREVFTIGSNSKATINDKASLFFHDYSIAPLFVQENYVHVMPTAAGGDKTKHLHLLSECADSICIGDVIEKRIRTQNSWNLLPVEAIFASVIPGDLLTGHLKQMVAFPAWLGKNSTRSHMDRVLQELQMHMRTRITGNKTDVSLEYLPVLRHALTNPLLEKEADGVKDVLKVMEYYCLLREDFDSIIELSLWPNQTDPRSKINAKVKSAFTRAYNKECPLNPYATTNVSKKKKGSAKDSELELLGGEEEAVLSEEENEDDDKVENDALIKVKKPAKATSAKADASTSKKSKASTKKSRS